MSEGKRNALTTIRKKLGHSSSLANSFHTKIPSAKSFSKTIHVTSRNTSV